MFMAIKIPNQIKSIPILSATGANMGMMMKAISKKSMNMPSKNTNKFTKIKKPIWPPGSLSNKCSTQMWPSAALKVKLKTVEPIKMNITKMERRVVLSSAPLSTLRPKRPRTVAITKAPRAPMAPPSVGVATPKKIVPNTKKIRINGGINTNVTCSVSLDISPRPVMRLTMASASARKLATVTDMMNRSSPGAGVMRSKNGFITLSWMSYQPKPTSAHSTIKANKDLWPLAPFVSV